MRRHSSGRALVFKKLFHLGYGVLASAAASAPTVSLPYATFQGFNDGNLTKFLGVQFAQAGRFETPRAPRILHGIQNATQFAPACPQQTLSPLPDPVPFVGGTYPSVSEDCLYLDIYKPIDSDAATKLPVFVWIFGGGFEVGNSRDVDLTPAVERSITAGQPVIVVALNYRVNAFGFLAGKEVAEAGVTNLGLRDQISGLEWVKQHIAAFGGDSDRVVIGGVSAGAVSTSLLLLNNKRDSNALFRGAFMDAGSPWPLPSVADGQSLYDGLVSANNCTTAIDTLNCLRQVPFNSLMASINKTPDFFSFDSIALAWMPRIDDDVVVNDPLDSVSHGLYSKAPLLTGDSDDEGTVFSVALLNITTGTEFLEYVHSVYLPNATPDQIAEIGHLYPEDPTEGSPFGTGTANQLSPEFKRLAAFQGDLCFLGPRRLLLEHASTRQNTWSWLNKSGKNSSYLGSFHGSDLAMWFPANLTTDVGTTAVDALVNFINTLDPNRPSHSSKNASSIFWPTWNTPSSTGRTSLLTFSDPSIVNITTEDFRVAPITYLNHLLRGEATSI